MRLRYRLGAPGGSSADGPAVPARPLPRSLRVFGGVLVGFSAMALSVQWWVGGQLSLTWDGRVLSRTVLWERRNRHYAKAVTRVITVPMVHYATRDFYETVCLLGRGGVTLTEGLLPPSRVAPSVAAEVDTFCRRVRWVYACIVEVLLVAAPRLVWQGLRCTAEFLYATQPSRRARLEDEEYAAPYRPIAGDSVVAQDFFDTLLLLSFYAENGDVRMPEAGEKWWWPLSVDFLIHKRNTHVLSLLDAREPDLLLYHSHFVLPWGAAHMGGIAEGLLQRGFVPVSSEWYTVFSASQLARCASAAVDDRIRLVQQRVTRSLALSA